MTAFVQSKSEPNFIPSDFELANLPRSPLTDHVQNALYDLALDPELFQVPRVLRKQLDVTDFLGSGAFGEVFKGVLKGSPAYHLSSTTSQASTVSAPNRTLASLGSVDAETTVALKSLKKGAQDKDRMDFLKEAKTLAKFNHENIVKLIGICLDNEPSYIVMELMEQGDLLSYLKRPEKSPSSVLSLSDLIDMCLDVAKGCAYLESEHFVHRDIAARNCLVSLPQLPVEKRKVKIGDFGMARDVYASDYYRIKGGEVKMPIKWLPPESLTDLTFTVKSDVWAFGVLLWEILTLGRQPYQGRNHEEVRSFVLNRGILDVPETCPSVIRDLMIRCWSYLPENRPSFLECLSTIQEFMLIKDEFLCDCCPWPAELPDKMLCHSAPGHFVASSWRTGSSQTATTLPMETATTDFSAAAMPFPPDEHLLDSAESIVAQFRNTCHDAGLRSHTSNPEQSTSLPIYLGPSAKSPHNLPASTSRPIQRRTAFFRISFADELQLQRCCTSLAISPSAAI